MTTPGDRVSFFVAGTPVTQGNHRVARHGRTYETTKGHSSWRASIAWLARHAWGSRPAMDCAVALDLLFYVPPPATARPGELPCKSGGDNSKLARAVEDSLEDAGVFENDRRITDLSVKRRYAFGEQPAGVLVSVGPAKG